MVRRRLIDTQTPQSRESAEALVRGSAPPRLRRAAKSNTQANRSGTVQSPYVREDGVQTAKFQAALNVDTLGRLDHYMLIVKPRGFTRGEWVEAAIDHCIAKGFMPPRKLQRISESAEEQSGGSAEVHISGGAEQQEGSAERIDGAPVLPAGRALGEG
jgi:hypothetical protein